MRDNPSNIPAGAPVRPVFAILILLVILILALTAGGLWGEKHEPTTVVVTASANNTLVDAARVHHPSDLKPGSPIGRAAIQAHSRNTTITVEGTTKQIEVVHVGGEKAITWISVNNTQYRVEIQPRE